MGADFAVFCAPGGADAVIAAATSVDLVGLRAGQVEPGPRAVHIRPLEITYEGTSLRLS